MSFCSPSCFLVFVNTLYMPPELHHMITTSRPLPEPRDVRSPLRWKWHKLAQSWVLKQLHVLAWSRADVVVSSTFRPTLLRLHMNAPIPYRRQRLNCFCPQITGGRHLLCWVP
jgi:hypothetical protein